MRKALLAALVLVIVAVAAFGFLAWRSEISPVDTPQASAFDKSDIERGAKLAALGNCNTCHTSSNGPAYSGGRAFETPFGTIYSTNITPDRDTGIGDWSEAAFRRAMHEGVNRQGQHLYPAFPYDHFTLVRDEDVRALYAFMMTRQPVRAQEKANRLMFPLGFRPLLAGWKLLHFKPARYAENGQLSREENRGGYLAEGLAHCGSCHTPRNSLGAEDRSKAYNGGEAGGWYAPGLNRNASSPIPWTTEQLATYLRNGFVADHGVAAGPMGEVVENLGRVDEADVRAIAAYIARSLVDGTKDRPRPQPAAQGPQAFWVSAGQGASQGAGKTAGKTADASPGALLYAGACAMCHEPNGLGFSARGIPLSQSKVVAMPDPRNIVHLILEGAHPPPQARYATMPGFANALDDAQVAAVAAYVRATFSKGPAWSGLESHSRSIRADMSRPEAK